jgi:hypothetical protein
MRIANSRLIACDRAGVTFRWKDAAPVSVLRRPHGHHRDIPARLLAALSSSRIYRRDQDRYIMIRLRLRRHSSALLLRRLSTGNDHARRRAATDCRLVVRSPLRDAGSLYPDRSIRIVTPSIASQPGVTPPAQQSP